MYRILLAIDRKEDRARRTAEMVASLPGSGEIEAVVLNVFEEFTATDDMGRVSSEDVYEESSLPNSVDVATELLEGTGIDTERRQEHGDPAKIILDVAEEVDADCIAMSGRKRSPAGKVLFGSVTQSVLLSSDRPVLISAVE